MNELKQLAALSAINNMLADRTFSICVVRDVAKLLGVQPEGDAYNILATLHCREWGNMPHELRAAVPELIRTCLGVEPAFQFAAIPRPVPNMPQPAMCVTPSQPGLLQLMGLRK